jgi:hypothetical protein
MKKWILAALTIATMSSELFAQEKANKYSEGPGQKIKAIYIAYITQEINLTEADAQKFWPLLTQFQDEIKEKNNDKLSELDKEEAILNVKKKYKDRFAKIIGDDRTNVFFKKDAEFRQKVAQRIKEQRIKRKRLQ